MPDFKKEISLVLLLIIMIPAVVFGQTMSFDVQSAIDQKNKQIEELERQINEYQNQIENE